MNVARKLRAAVAERGFDAQQQKFAVTASFGLCGMESVPVGRNNAESLVKVADAALYKSKNMGRNRVTATRYPGAVAAKHEAPI